MAKFRIVPESETVNQLQFWCPGCDQPHALNTTWKFNGDIENPTVSPSVLVRGVGANHNGVCHSFINDGKIQFLNDCTHPLKGLTVELPQIE